MVTVAGAEVLSCQRCGRPVVQSREQYGVLEKGDDLDPDLACPDPSCPTRMIDPNAPPDWFVGRADIER